MSSPKRPQVHLCQSVLQLSLLYEPRSEPANSGRSWDSVVRMFLVNDPSCCCLPTPMTLASGGSPIFPLVVHQPASPSIWPAVQSLQRGLSTNSGDNVVYVIVTKGA